MLFYHSLTICLVQIYFGTTKVVNGRTLKVDPVAKRVEPISAIWLNESRLCLKDEAKQIFVAPLYGKWVLVVSQNARSYVLKFNDGIKGKQTPMIIPFRKYLKMNMYKYIAGLRVNDVKNYMVCHKYDNMICFVLVRSSSYQWVWQRSYMDNITVQSGWLVECEFETKQPYNECHLSTSLKQNGTYLNLANRRIFDCHSHKRMCTVNNKNQNRQDTDLTDEVFQRRGYIYMTAEDQAYTFTSGPNNTTQIFHLRDSKYNFSLSSIYREYSFFVINSRNTAIVGDPAKDIGRSCPEKKDDSRTTGNPHTILVIFTVISSCLNIALLLSLAHRIHFKSKIKNDVDERISGAASQALNTNPQQSQKTENDASSGVSDTNHGNSDEFHNLEVKLESQKGSDLLHQAVLTNKNADMIVSLKDVPSDSVTVQTLRTGSDGWDDKTDRPKRRHEAVKGPTNSTQRTSNEISPMVSSEDWSTKFRRLMKFKGKMQRANDES